MIRRKCFGFFVFDFLLIPNSQLVLNGIKCHLDSLSSACFAHRFISSENSMLYLPFLYHPNIKSITVPTFFHLCRLQNISFDIEKKIGNVFIFLDGMESGCLGMMTFSKGNKLETFIHAAEAINFFSSKMVKSSNCEEFLLLRNSINGYLNHLQKKNSTKLGKELQG